HREVAEVSVGENQLQTFQLFRYALELAAAVANAGARGPVQTLGEPAELQPQQAEVEHLQRLFARLQSVVIALDETSLRHRAMGLEQVEHRLRQLFLTVVVFFDAAGDAELIE